MGYDITRTQSKGENMYRYKKVIQRDLHQLYLCEWFRNNFGTIGEQQIRYKLYHNKNYLILIGTAIVDVTHLGYDYFRIEVYRPVLNEKSDYIYESSFGDAFWFAKMKEAYILTDLDSIGNVFEWDAYKLARSLEENETQKIILTQSYEMLEITLCKKSERSVRENNYLVVVKRIWHIDWHPEELRGQGKIFISEERANILISRIYGERELEKFKKNKSFHGKIPTEDEDTELTFWGLSLKIEKKESKDEVFIKLEESTAMCYSSEENGARKYYSSRKVGDRRYYELEVY